MSDGPSPVELIQTRLQRFYLLCHFPRLLRSAATLNMDMVWVSPLYCSSGAFILNSLFARYFDLTHRHRLRQCLEVEPRLIDSVRFTLSRHFLFFLPQAHNVFNGIFIVGDYNKEADAKYGIITSQPCIASSKEPN